MDEKNQLEEIIIKQEENVINLLYLQLNKSNKKVGQLEEKVKTVTEDYKNCESQSLMLVKKIEDQKKQIVHLNNKIDSKKEDEEKVKYNFIEKDQEIRFLKNFISNLKSDNKGKGYG